MSQPLPISTHPNDRQPQFVSDISPPDCCHGVILRGWQVGLPVATLRLPRLPREYHFIGAADIPGENLIALPGAKNEPLLALHETGWCGQPLGLLTGPSPKILADIVATLDLPKPPTTADDNHHHPEPPANDPTTIDNIVGEIERGTPRRSPSDAPSLELQFHIDSLYSPSREAMQAVALRQEEHYTIWCASRWPHLVQQVVCRIMGFDVSHCRVIATRVDHDLGARMVLPALLAALAVLAAWRCRRPVRVVQDNTQRLAPSRPPVTIYYRGVLDSDRHAHTVDSRIQFHGLPDWEIGKEIIARTMHSAVGAYDWRYLRIAAITAPQMCHAIGDPHNQIVGDLGESWGIIGREIGLTYLAHLARQSPLAWRQQLLTPKKWNLEVLRRAAILSDFERKHDAYELQRQRRHDDEADDSSIERRYGIGIAISEQHADFQQAMFDRPSVHLRLEQNNRAVILCSALSQPWSAPPVWRRIVADILDIPPENVLVMPADTATVPDSGPSFPGRNITVISRLVRSCALSIRRRQRHSPPPLEARHTFGSQPKIAVRRQSFAAAVVALSIDPCQVEIAIEGIWMVVNAGAIQQRDVAQFTLESSLFNALQWCMIDDMQFENFRAPNARIELVKSPRTTYIAPLDTLAFGAVPAAYIGALSQAINRPIAHLPFGAISLRSPTKTHWQSS